MIDEVLGKLKLEGLEAIVVPPKADEEAPEFDGVPVDGSLKVDSPE